MQQEEKRGKSKLEKAEILVLGIVTWVLFYMFVSTKNLFCITIKWYNKA